MRLCVWAPHMANAGKVCLKPVGICETSFDIRLFGEGTKAELIQQARRVLQNATNSAPAKREAEHVLEYFGEEN